MASAMENVATNGQAGPVAVVQGGALAVAAGQFAALIDQGVVDVQNGANPIEVTSTGSGQEFRQGRTCTHVSDVIFENRCLTVNPWPSFSEYWRTRTLPYVDAPEFDDDRAGRGTPGCHRRLV